MKEGRGEARRISEALKGVSDRVEDFKVQWTEITAGALKDIETKLVSLQFEIDEMMKHEAG